MAITANSSKALESSLCCGCAACSIVCPTRSIEMRFIKGSYRPSVDYDSCVSCGLCISVCQALDSSVTVSAMRLEDAESYVAVSKDKDVLNASSSGGVGFSLGKTAINHGIPYCAASYIAERKRCEHVICRDYPSLPKTQGSKYLQSACESAFKELMKESVGLVVGTPCQIAGLDRLLKRAGKRDRFVLVDVFCHGVPNELLWERHLEWLKLKKGVSPTAPASFRRKKDYILRIDGYEAWYNEDAFLTFFLRGWLNNRACYSCKYRRASHADLRIGDLTAEKYKRLPYSPSCILSITERGACFLDDASGQLEMYRESYSTIDDTQEYGDLPVPHNYEMLCEALESGEVPEAMIRSTMLTGRFKSFVKHVVMKPFSKSVSMNLSDCVEAQIGGRGE